MDRLNTLVPKMLGGAFVGITLLGVLANSTVIVEEGHVGIVKRLGEAKTQLAPGFHLKAPFIDSIEEIEVRTRKNEELMTSSTKEEMPVDVSASVNWTVHRDSAIELYKKYGSLDQFEQRVLDPRFRSAVKTAVPKFDAEKLIQDRSVTVSMVEEILDDEMVGYPVSIDNVQIENIRLPGVYLESIQEKQTEKNRAKAEEHRLARQNFTAQQAVNTANAEAEAIKVVAEAEAEKIRVKGLAEADAIKAKGEALKNNPLLVELTQAQTWNGQLPRTVMGGEGTLPILDMRE